MSRKFEVPVPNLLAEPKTFNEYVDVVLEHKEHIDCLYFPLGWCDTDVDVWGIRAPNFVYVNGQFQKDAVLDWETALKQLIEYTNLPVKVLANNTFNPAFQSIDGLNVIRRKLDYYHTQFDVKGVTIADVSLIPHLSDYKIGLSTNSHRSFQELDAIFTLHDPAQISSICLQRDLQRNPNKLRSYAKRRDIWDKIVLMANEGCVSGCPYKEPGDIEISVSDIKTGHNQIHKIGCGIIDAKKPWLFLTAPFLTRQMLDEYYADVAVVKLAGRELSASRIRKQLEHYTGKKEHALKKILNVSMATNATAADLSPEYVKRVMSCNKECFVCNDCENEFHELMKHHDSKYEPLVFHRMTSSTFKDMP